MRLLTGVPTLKHRKNFVFRLDNWQDPNRRQDDLNIFERPAKSVNLWISIYLVFTHIHPSGGRHRYV